MSAPEESPAAMFQRRLNIGARLAAILANGGLTSIEEVAYIPHWELAKLGQLDEEETKALRNRAREILDATGSAARGSD